MKRLLKRMLCPLICLLLCRMPIYAIASNYQTENNVGFDAALAEKLNKLGLFMGVSANIDGTNDYDLDRKPNRLEALVMLVRALGKKSQAEAYPKTHPFADVPSWADGYVSYAYDKGLTKGLSDKLFGSKETASAEMYLTFMLRALGYSDAEGGDFVWNAPWALAAWCGILPSSQLGTDFLRADAVDVTCAALYSRLKGSQTTLYERLISAGCFTRAQFASVFADRPSNSYNRLDTQISKAIAAARKLGLSDGSKYSAECHIITDINDCGDVIKVSALVCLGDAALSEDFGSIRDFKETIDLWLLELDPDTMECLSCRTAEELAAQGLSLESYFSGKTLTARETLSKGMSDVCKMSVQMQIDEGMLGYRKRYDSYDKALAAVKASITEISQNLETELCTIISGKLGGVPHGPIPYLYLVYKPGSYVGEGITVRLPLPRENYIGLMSEPENLKLSENSLTLYYSKSFSKRLVFDEGLPSENVVHEAGTYSYTVDLKTGVTSLTVFPNG